MSRLRQSTMVLLVALLLVLTGAGSASAHDVLTSTDPAEGAVLPNAPTTITLHFAQEVASFEPEVAVTIGSASTVLLNPQVAGSVVTASLAGTTVNTSPGHSTGTWKVGYRIVSADGHPVTGLLTFVVGAPSPSSAAAGAGTAAGTGGGSGGMSPWIFGGAGVLLLVVVGVVVVMIRRRPRPGRPASA